MKPQIVIPVHGEALHLHEQPKLARAAGVDRSSRSATATMVRLAPGAAEQGRQRSRPAGSTGTASLVGASRRAASPNGGGWASPAMSASRSCSPTAARCWRIRRSTLVGLPAADADGRAVRGDRSMNAVDDALGLAAASRAGAIRKSCARRCAGPCAPRSTTAWGKKPVCTVVRRGRMSDGDDRPAEPRRASRCPISRPPPRSIANARRARSPSPSTCPSMASRSSSSSCPTPGSSCSSRSATTSPIAGFLERNPDRRHASHLLRGRRHPRRARPPAGAKGARILGDGEPKIGAHGKPVIFLHPKDFPGTLIELEQA